MRAIFVIAGLCILFAFIIPDDTIAYSIMEDTVSSSFINHISYLEKMLPSPLFDMIISNMTGFGPLISSPFSPSPADGAENVSKDVILSWKCNCKSALFYVYIGDEDVGDKEKMDFVGATMKPFYKVSLERGKTYYWKVVAFSKSGWTSSKIWKFRTSEKDEIKKADDESRYNWTFMFYINGDNDLHSYAKNEVSELMEINESEMAIAVLFDGNENNDSYFYAITNFTYEEMKGELNMGDGSTLADFISYVKENYPARHYFLEIWGHGNSWMGTCFDRSNMNMLTMTEIKNAIDHVDILLFSSCYMGSIEVAYSLRNDVDYFLAPEEEMLATGMPLTRIFNVINASMNSEEICRKIIDEYEKYYFYTTTNFAVWNMSKLDELANALHDFVTSLKNESYIEILQIRNNTILQSIQYIDLYEFVSMAIQQFNISEAENVLNLINETIIAKFGNMHGIQIYFPLPIYYSKYYKDTEFASATGWNKLIEFL